MILYGLRSEAHFAGGVMCKINIPNWFIFLIFGKNNVAKVMKIHSISYKNNFKTIII